MKTTLILLIGLLAGSAGAAVIALDDADFASQTVNSIYVADAHDAGTTAWDDNLRKTQYKIYVTNVVDHTTGLILDGSPGSGVLNVHYGYVFQNLTNTYVTGKTYTLTVWMATSSPTSSDVGGYLKFTDASGAGNDGGNVLSSSPMQHVSNFDNGDIAYDDWEQLTWSYRATVADNGKPIGISIQPRVYMWVDDVSLTVKDRPVIDLAAYTNNATSATFNKHMNANFNYSDSDPNDDVPDDAYYANGGYIQYSTGSIKVGNTSGGPETDGTAWEVWAFDAPYGMLITGFYFWTDIHIETTVTNSSYTYYYNIGTYDGLADPVPGANGWTQFAQMVYGDDNKSFPGIAFTPTARVYVAFKLDRVVNAGATANWWDDQQQQDSYTFDLMPIPRGTVMIVQ